MFGNKRRKQDRLAKIGEVLQGADNGLTQAELARRVGVTRATILKDLGIIREQRGILLWEDDDGRLHWFDPEAL